MSIEDHNWIENIFQGDPPKGYDSWFDWARAATKKGAVIRAAEPEDWNYHHSSPTRRRQ